MSFRIDHEGNSKSVNVSPVDGGINNINIEKASRKRTVPIEDFREDDHRSSEANLGLDFLTNEAKRVPETPQTDPNAEGSEYTEEGSGESGGSYDDGDSRGEGYMNDNMDNRRGYYPEPPIISYEEMQQQKAYYLSQLKRLEKQGYLSVKRYGVEHPLEDIKGEVLRIRKERELEDGIKYCKQGLMFFVSTIEMANERFDPFGAKLSGWSNVVMAEQDSYDGVFEELYEKYHTKIQMAPEIKLLSMIAGSAMMFHLQKSLVDKAMGSSDIAKALSSILGGNKGASADVRPPQEEMRGPSMNTDELLRKLSEENVSDISSMTSGDSEINEKVINIPIPKKRGRKPKNTA